MANLISLLLFIIRLPYVMAKVVYTSGAFVLLTLPNRGVKYVYNSVGRSKKSLSKWYFGEKINEDEQVLVPAPKLIVWRLISYLAPNFKKWRSFSIWRPLEKNRFPFIIRFWRPFNPICCLDNNNNKVVRNPIPSQLSQAPPPAIQ